MIRSSSLGTPLGEIDDRLALLRSRAPTWTALGPVHGDGLEKTVTHPLGQSRFYRVRRTTP